MVSSKEKVSVVRGKLFLVVEEEAGAADRAGFYTIICTGTVWTGLNSTASPLLFLTADGLGLVAAAFEAVRSLPDLAREATLTNPLAGAPAEVDAACDDCDGW